MSAHLEVYKDWLAPTHLEVYKDWLAPLHLKVYKDWLASQRGLESLRASLTTIIPKGGGGGKFSK